MVELNGTDIAAFKRRKFMSFRCRISVCWDLHMLRYPGEEEYSEFLQTEIEWHFDFARRLYGHWLPHDRDRWLNKSKLPGIIQDAAMIVDLQMCRQFRSVYDECARGEAICATIIGRSLFESLLALQFVLKPRLYIVLEPERDKLGSHKQTRNGEFKYEAFAPSKNHPQTASSFLPRLLRAQIYLAHQMLRQAAFLPGRLQEWKMKRLANSMKKDAFNKEVLAYFGPLIGPEWTYILKTNSYYSGLNIGTLAEILGPTMHRWHQTVYSVQSSSVHANEPISLFRLNEDKTAVLPSHFSPPDDVRRALTAAIGTFLFAVIYLQQHIGFGDLNETVLGGLKTEYLQRFKN